MTQYGLQDLLPAFLFGGLLVFARTGSAIGLLPGFGDAFVPVRIRLVVALGVAAVIYPVLAADLPPEPPALLRMVVLLSGEVFIGLFIGLAARVMLAALETAGAIIAMQSSLAAAITFDPGAQQPQTLPSSLLGVLAIVLMFVTDTYALLLRAVADSYHAFPAGALPPFDDMSVAMVRLVAHGFAVSVELAAPYLVIGTLFYVVLGLLGRIMPQLQIFFLALPAQVLGGLAVLALTLSASMLWYLGVFQNAILDIAQSP